MSDIIRKHPCLLFSPDIADICRPLKNLNITHFGHVNIDKDKKFSAVTNNAAFFEHYLRNHYYNADLHTAGTKKLGNMVMWDLIERSGLSEKMHREAAVFGVQHTFSIMEEDETGLNCYHFANDQNDNSINQFYIANQDLLRAFILYFKERMSQAKELAASYQMKFSMDDKIAGYSIKSSANFHINEILRQEFMRKLTLDRHLPTNGQLILPNAISANLDHYPLTEKERICAEFLCQGLRTKEIAFLTHRSPRTIEKHILALKEKLNVKNINQLMGKLLAPGF